jgi:hypothetical protein
MKSGKWLASMLGAILLVGAAANSASASTIQLGFILDRSGSIGAGNWTTIVNGLSTAVNTEIPLAGADTYEVSVVTFATTATIDIANYLVTDATSRTALAALIAAIPFSGGGTNFGPAFTAMLDALNNTPIGTSYVNFATDGVESDPAAGVAARNALIAAGVDNISIEGIGAGVDAAGLQGSYCYPGPCDTTIPFNFPAQGFYIGVANAQGYADAIGNKIQVVTQNPTAVPEPGTLSLLGIGGALRLWAKRRRKQART